MLIGGCTTIMNGPTQEIKVTSNPPGATVTPTDYKYWTKTPGVIALDRNNSTVLTARLYGYEDAKQEIKCGLSPWVFGNAAGQLYPWAFMGVPHGAVALGILDVSTGSIGNLTPTEIHFELVPKK
jgi:hypothetical protein